MTGPCGGTVGACSRSRPGSRSPPTLDLAQVRFSGLWGAASRLSKRVKAYWVSEMSAWGESTAAIQLRCAQLTTLLKLYQPLSDGESVLPEMSWGSRLAAAGVSESSCVCGMQGW